MILIILPTRNRPENVKKFYTAWKKNTSGNSRVLLMTDYDDKNDYTYTGFTTDTNKRFSAVKKINLGAERHSNDFDIIGFLGDDTVIETKNFDKMVEERIVRFKYGMLRPYNGHDEEEQPDHIFMTKELYKFLGWFAYPKMHHSFIDYVWLDIAKLVDYVYDKDILIRHEHPYYDDKIFFDAIYKYAYGYGWPAKDKAIFKGKWKEELERIKERL